MMVFRYDKPNSVSCQRRDEDHLSGRVVASAPQAALPHEKWRHGLAPSGVYHAPLSPGERRRSYLLLFTYRSACAGLFCLCGTFPISPEGGRLVLPTTLVATCGGCSDFPRSAQGRSAILCSMNGYIIKYIENMSRITVVAIEKYVGTK